MWTTLCPKGISFSLFFLSWADLGAQVDKLIPQGMGNEHMPAGKLTSHCVATATYSGSIRLDIVGLKPWQIGHELLQFFHEAPQLVRLLGFSR